MAQFNRTPERRQYDKDFPDLDRAKALAMIGRAFYEEFGHRGLLSDLDRTIEMFQRVVSLIPDGHNDKSAWLHNLGVAFGKRFEHTGVLSDLEEGIKCRRQVVLLAPDGHPDRPAWLAGLAVLLQNRFERTGILSDLEEAIMCQRQALSLAPDGHADKPAWLSILGFSLESRFVRTGILSELEEVIKCFQQAVLLTPDGDANKAMRLNNLGVSFGSLFERTGLLSHLEEAIKNQQQAVMLTPDGHADKPSWLTNLGSAFNQRFRHTGMLNDLMEAIKNSLEAVLFTPEWRTGNSAIFSNLGTVFSTLFTYTGKLSDLEEAIKYHQQAVLLSSDGDPGKSGWLNNLGISLQRRFECTGMLSDLEDAIKNQQQAVLLAPDGHVYKPSWLTNLGVSHDSQFRRTGMLSSLEDAVKYFQHALSLTPDHDANKPARLKNLAISLQARFELTGSPNDLGEAISHLQSAAISSLGPPVLRCDASRKWARLEIIRNPLSGLIPYRRAIDLIQQLSWIGDPIATRHSQLNDLSDIPREAAAFALDMGCPDLALEWLEQGRSVVWSQLLNLRIPPHDLPQDHPDICAEFIQVSNDLQSAATRGHTRGSSENVKIFLEEETQRHHRSAEKWDLLVERIRMLRGFEDFLLPKQVSELKKAASSGPVVVINVHQRRCDALVLESSRDHVLHIPLNDLRYEDLDKMRTALRKDLIELGYRGTGPPAESLRPARILSTLYSHVVYPILQSLGLATVEPDPLNLPRIWWCPTGPLTFLPLHAACRQTATGIDGVFKYAVSSYIPTVNALIEARAAKRQPFNRIVGIGMTNTPGECPLPGAEKELKEIGNTLSANSRWRYEMLRNEQATGEQVLARMANSSWVHLACHAVQDVQEPTQSGFCLHDRRLTITDIVATPFANADLAFLSACETATGDERTSDETVHVTGAMLGAGYRSVIGTMWSIPDEAAPIIAGKVYENLLSGGEPNSEQAARALHEAVKELRMSDHDSFNSWVPFVHYGV